MLVKKAVTLYFGVRPVGFRNAIRLYISFTASMALRILTPSRFRPISFLPIPGKSRLTVSTRGIFAHVIPGTDTLAALSGVFEPNTVRWFNTGPGEVVVDIGAHIGRYTLVAAKNVAKVVAVEPNLANFSLLEENIRLNGFTNVIALPLALSDKPGKRRFYLASGADTATSSLEPTWKLDPTKHRSSIDASCETLDRVADYLRLDKIDWLKIDVEGHEVSVLKGGLDTLKKTKRLILEVAEGNEEACLKIIRDSGFELASVDQRKKEDGVLTTSNWLVLRRETTIHSTTLKDEAGFLKVGTKKALIIY